jgi:hypothetical protein
VRGLALGQLGVQGAAAARADDVTRSPKMLAFVEEHHFVGGGVAVPFASMRQRG